VSVFTIIKLALKYWPTISAGIDAANRSPEIVAAIKAAVSALDEFHGTDAPAHSVAPAPMKPPVPMRHVIEMLQKQDDQHGPEGQSQPSL
jgi:hypothetical protein